MGKTQRTEVCEEMIPLKRGQRFRVTWTDEDGLRPTTTTLTIKMASQDYICACGEYIAPGDLYIPHGPSDPICLDCFELLDKEEISKGEPGVARGGRPLARRLSPMDKGEQHAELSPCD